MLLYPLLFLKCYIMGVVGSLIGGASQIVGGIGSTVASNAANKEIAQMNNAFNEKMFDKQVNYNKEMYQQQLGDQWKFYNDAKQNSWDLYNDQKQNSWDLYNDQKKFQTSLIEDQKQYNSASAQRERLEAAGLNPYLMMQGGSAGTVSNSSAPSGSAPGGSAPSAGSAPGAMSVSPPTATPYSADYSAMSQALGNAIDMYYRNQESSTRVANMRIEGKYKAAEMLSRIDNVIQNTKSQKVRTQLEQLLSYGKKELLDAQVDQTKMQTAYQNIQIHSAVLDNMQKVEQLKVLPQQLQNSLSEQAARIAQMRASKKLTDVQVKHEIAKIVNTQLSSDVLAQQDQSLTQQNQAFADQYKINKNKLIAEMYHAVLNVGFDGFDGLWKAAAFLGNSVDAGIPDTSYE